MRLSEHELHIMEIFSEVKRRRLNLGLRRDLSLQPDLFGHQLQLKGLYIWGRALSHESRILAETDFNAILFNETDPAKVEAGEGYQLFTLRDLQEFPYLIALRMIPGLK